MSAQRFISLDVFRGATVALMILVNNPGTWSHMYAPLAHAPWHGVTLTDLVFPFFLFAVGNAMAFALPPAVLNSPGFYRKVAKRTAWIFGLGLFLNISPFVRWSAEGDLVWRSLESLRIMGVLQRIALAYCFAALLIKHLPARSVGGVAAALLLVYWAVCLLLGQPGDPYSLEGFWGTGVDRAVLGNAHLYKGEGVPFDPEGLASTLPCISQVLIGYLVGRWLSANSPSARTVARLLFVGLLLLLLGLAWSQVMPLNKKLWTSSYVMLTSGWAVLTLAGLVWLLELKRARGIWSEFSLAFGSNALFIFCLSGFLPRVIALLRWPDGTAADGQIRYTTPLRWLHDVAIAPWFADPRAGSLLYALVMIAFYWLIADQLRRHKIFIKV